MAQTGEKYTEAKRALLASGHARVGERPGVPVTGRDDAPSGESLMSFLRVIAHGDHPHASGLLTGAPELAWACLAQGATRQRAAEYVLDEIGRTVYAGDTALHIAAACYATDMIRALVSVGAKVSAANRRGAQPLHYAVDGGPGDAHWDPDAQRDAVLWLVRLGADPNAPDKNGTAPLHRAVRNRCAAAVKALLDGGADPHATNRSGSTPLQLASWTTGRSGTGSSEAKEQQREILGLLQTAGVT
jgi:hypothetical protein